VGCLPPYLFWVWRDIARDITASDEFVLIKGVATTIENSASAVVIKGKKETIILYMIFFVRFG
jgi:hypothetical protein